MSFAIKASSDIFIKYLFGTERNKDLLLSFINAVLNDAGFDTIIDLELTNPFNIKTFVLDKESILDIKAIDKMEGSMILKFNPLVIKVLYKELYITGQGCIRHKYRKAKSIFT